jgi:hypothetical protein
MIRCTRLFSSDDGESHFETQAIELAPKSAEGSLSALTVVQDVPFGESPAGSYLDWQTRHTMNMSSH